MFRKVLVANRGEIALRILRACREMGIRTVAVYSDADREAHYVTQADESWPLGPSPARESYLRIDKILEAARRARAQAIHPGYGFLAENAEFSRACARAGIKFVGPGPRAMDLVGRKIPARKLAEKLGLPVIPGLSRPVDAGRARAFARRHGYPIVVKATAGGGGKGMRVVPRAADLARALRESAGEAESSFGDGQIFVEKYLDRPRHVEIQVVADGRGHVIHLGERECSIQRRHQKLVEESPSPALDGERRERLGTAACKLLRAAGYEGAGTCEFLLEEDGTFRFLEVNARLQVEHPVTEMVTGLDLVKLQLAVAAGEKLPLRQEEVRLNGHAVEARICAEDPFADFAPAAGRVEDVRFPGGPFVRVDSDLVPGAEMGVYYDSLVAKLIAWGPDRPAALDRALRALRELIVTGVPTTTPFHVRLFEDARFRAGKIHTKFLETFQPAPPAAERLEEAAMLAAALETLCQGRSLPRRDDARPLSSWRRAFREEEAR